MKSRYVLINIESIANLLKEYADPNDLPADARPVQLMLKPTEQGSLALVMESPTWSHGLAPLRIRTDLRRIHGVS